MAKRTEREFHIALGRLLDRVRVQNSWSKDSFHDAAKHVANVTPAEAARFFKALTKTEYLKQGSDKRRLTQNFKQHIWKNQDAMIAVVKEILETEDITRSRGPKLGSHRKPKTVTTEPMEIEIIPKEVVNPLEYFTPQDLVTELRNRGFTVTASRQIITIEEL